MADETHTSFASARIVARMLLALVLATSAIAQDTAVLVIADGGSTYHRPDCPTIKGIKRIDNYKRESLPKNSEPCSICRPNDAAIVVEPAAPAAPGSGVAAKKSPSPAVPGARRWNDGPQLLTPATYQEAITCGKESPWWRYCAEENLLLCNADQIDVSLISPFVRVMVNVRDATHQLLKPAPPDLAAVNKTPFTVTVSPSSDFLKMRSPSRMVAEKNGGRHQPTTSKLTPLVMSNAFGAKRNGTRGEFEFPLSLFSVGSPTTLLIALDVGGPVTCEIQVEKLRQMR